MPGTTTLAAEVTHISKHGFWLLLADEELLVPFDQFPWFRQGTVAQISDVQWPRSLGGRRETPDGKSAELR